MLSENFVIRCSVCLEEGEDCGFFYFVVANFEFGRIQKEMFAVYLYGRSGKISRNISKDICYQTREIHRNGMGNVIVDLCFSPCGPQHYQ